MTCILGTDSIHPIIYLNEYGPNLVLWMATFPENGEDKGWGQIFGGHSCGGFSCDELAGYVKILSPACEFMALLKNIANEEFCHDCEDDLDYGVTAKHRAAYSYYLRQHGMEPGSISLLQQAVYPLAIGCLERMGIYGIEVPQGAHLFLLGDNCD